MECSRIKSHTQGYGIAIYSFSKSGERPYHDDLDAELVEEDRKAFKAG